MTAYNAKYVVDNKIGPGSVIRVIRSGAVIPKIIEVVKPSRIGRATLPNSVLVGDYEWDENGTHLVLKKAGDSSVVRAKKIARFYAMIGAEFIGEGVAKKMVAAGFDTVFKAAKMTQEQFARLEGFGEQSATRAATSLAKVYKDQVPLPELMIATGLFPKGVGVTFLNKVIGVDPSLIYKSDDYELEALREELNKIPGLTQIFVDGFVDNQKRFWVFQEKTGISFKAFVKPRTAKGPLLGQSVSWTGYRNKEEEQRVVALGGNVISFGSSTTVLIYSPEGKESSKVEKAKAKGIKVMTFAQLLKTSK